MRVRWHLIFVIAVFFFAIIGGAFAYHSVEGWSYIDSAYFLVITATTIGYGDIAPQTDLGKIITMFYSFLGIAFVFYIISLMTHYIFEKKIRSRVAVTREHMKDEQELKEAKKKIRTLRKK